ncbi:molybdenum cofactor guanylyltransferase [Corallincola platygyrae]|uniref:Molybdenum cofactor guanylyltransferase n=1 Tax=Corallincola platygyrae TaxID=1193278 RepID=A0ABW4XNA4_9GAMM
MTDTNKTDRHTIDINALGKKTIGIVLAGGRSSRMGTDKALLALNGQTLLQQSIDRLQQAGCQQVYVSGDYPGTLSVPDQSANRGPLAGLQAVLKDERIQQCQGQALVVIPVDMPTLPAIEIKRVVEHREDFVAFKKSFFPLKLKLNTHLVQVVDDLLANEDRRLHSIKALLEHLSTLWLPLPEQASLFANVNTPEQWRALLRHKSAQAPSK